MRNLQEKLNERDILLDEYFKLWLEMPLTKCLVEAMNDKFNEASIELVEFLRKFPATELPIKIAERKGRQDVYYLFTDKKHEGLLEFIKGYFKYTE